jgi:hypothetical protein
MRNKILKLIYKRLEKPTKDSTFNRSSPYSIDYVGFLLNIRRELMDFSLHFSDGQPSIFVKKRRTDTPWLIHKLGFGDMYRTTVTCGPLIFVLTPLEQEALEITLRQHHEKHLQLKFDHEFQQMKEKVNSRLNEYE